jgi:hypothetical protein
MTSTARDSLISELVARLREQVPALLRELPVWLLHDRYKVPIYASGNNRRGATDTPEDRDELVSFEDAAAALTHLGRACSLGVVLGEVPGEEVRLCGTRHHRGGGLHAEADRAIIR